MWKELLEEPWHAAAISLSKLPHAFSNTIWLRVTVMPLKFGFVWEETVSLQWIYASKLRSCGYSHFNGINDVSIQGCSMISSENRSNRNVALWDQSNFVLTAKISLGYPSLQLYPKRNDLVR